VHWFDIAVTIALILSCVWSFYRGLIRDLLSLLGLVAASVLAVRGYAAVANVLAPFIALEWVRQAIGFALIFLAVMAITMVCSALLRLVIRTVGLSLLDRLLGGLFGLAKVVLVASVLLIMASKFFPPETDQLKDKLKDKSTLAPLLFRSADYLTTLLDQHTDRVQELYKRLPLPH
jgi:membrane protein required for colicin V production